MRLLMISGDRSILQGKKSPFWYMLEEMSKHWKRIDIICPWTTRDQKPTLRLRSGQETRNQIGERSEGQKVFPNVFFHPSPRGLWYQPWWILQKGSELITEHHHSVMTVHEYPPFYNGIGARWLSRSTELPFILEVHHVVGFPRASSISEYIGYWMSRVYLPRAARRAAAVRCVSFATADLLRRWGVQNIEIVPSFYLDPETLHPDPDVPRTYDVVTAARLVPNKGMREVIEALKSMPPHRRLLIVGEGPEKSKLQAHARRHGVHERVVFSGWLKENHEVYYALQTGWVFVMNSRSEGGPRVALEAMALGLPVVATPVGVMPDVIRHGENALFTTGHAEDLAAKIEQLLADEELRKKIGEEARKILDRFERRTLIREYADFLKRYMRQ